MRLESTEDPDGSFFRALASEGHHRGCADWRTGVYCATPDGRLLGSHPGGDRDAVVGLAQRALAAFSALPGSLWPAAQDRPDPAGATLFGITRRIPENRDPRSSPKHPARRWFSDVSAAELRSLWPSDWDRPGVQRWPRDLVVRLVSGPAGLLDEEPPLDLETVVAESGPRFVRGNFRRAAASTRSVAPSAAVEGEFVYDRRDDRCVRFDLVVLGVGTDGFEGSVVRQIDPGARPAAISGTGPVPGASVR